MNVNRTTLYTVTIIIKNRYLSLKAILKQTFYKERENHFFCPDLKPLLLFPLFLFMAVGFRVSKSYQNILLGVLQKPYNASPHTTR